jgi:hypothetical protein
MRGQAIEQGVLIILWMRGQAIEQGVLIILWMRGLAIEQGVLIINSVMPNKELGNKDKLF